MIIDTHVHVTAPDRDRYPVAPTGIGSDWWRSGEPSAESLLGSLDQSGVTAALVVQAVGVYGFDNGYVLDVAARHDRLSAVVAVDLDAAGFEQEIERLTSKPGVAGVRLFAMTSARQWVGTARTAAALDAAAASGVPAVLTVPSDDILALKPAIDASPQAAIALDHCGFPTHAGALIAPGEPVLALAESPNVVLKVSSHNLLKAAAEGDPASLVDQLAAAFGPARLLWASDFPQTRADDYGALLNVAANAARSLDGEQRRGFLGGNAALIFARAGSRTSCDVTRQPAPRCARGGQGGERALG